MKSDYSIQKHKLGFDKQLRIVISVCVKNDRSAFTVPYLDIQAKKTGVTGSSYVSPIKLFGRAKFQRKFVPKKYVPHTHKYVPPHLKEVMKNF